MLVTGVTSIASTSDPLSHPLAPQSIKYPDLNLLVNGLIKRTKGLYIQNPFNDYLIRHVGKLPRSFMRKDVTICTSSNWSGRNAIRVNGAFIVVSSFSL
jgi:hypothetical protein